MSYVGHLSRNRGHGIFAAAGLGQVAKGGKTGTSTEPDRTASDWATGLNTAGSLVSSIVGAATGAPTTAAATDPTIDPATAFAPPVSASPDWYWPVVIGVGVAVLGGIAYMSYNVKAPVKANRRKSRLRRNYSYQHTSHPGSYDSHGRPRRNSRRKRRSRRS